MSFSISQECVLSPVNSWSHHFQLSAGSSTECLLAEHVSVAECGESVLLLGILQFCCFQYVHQLFHRSHISRNGMCEDLFDGTATEKVSTKQIQDGVGGNSS